MAKNKTTQIEAPPQEWPRIPQSFAQSGGRKEIVQAWDISEVNETYEGNVQITDLREELGTQGHVLVVRGDLAYSDALGEDSDLANPKFWLYENLINSPRDIIIID